MKKGLAIAVHVLSTSGVALAFGAIMLIMKDDAVNAFRLLALAALIDSIDGTLARWVDVGRYTPEIDGSLIDNLVDYLTWVFVPMIWAWNFLEIHWVICVAVMFSSMLGFSHVRAKTPDHFFRGFPSYWNIVILYLFILDAGTQMVSLVLIVLAVLVLVPVKFIYPSRTLVMQKTTLVLSVPYLVMLVFMLGYFEATPIWLVLVSLYYPVYYLMVSLYLTLKETGLPNHRVS